MKKLLIILCIFYISCSKQEEDSCRKLIHITTLYNEKWEIIEEWKTDFGVVCDEELARYKQIIQKQGTRGYMICPPELRYSKFILL